MKTVFKNSLIGLMVVGMLLTGTYQVDAARKNKKSNITYNVAVPSNFNYSFTILDAGTYVFSIPEARWGSWYRVTVTHKDGTVVGPALVMGTATFSWICTESDVPVHVTFSPVL